jgi:peptide/nickel transport system substrate-binding protein
MNRWTAVLVVVGLGLTACTATPSPSPGGSGAASPSGSGAVSCEQASPQETLTVAMDGDIETIDPVFSHFQKANEVNYNVEDQFFRYDTSPGDNGTPVYDPTKILGSSVESWELADDQMSIVLDIRQGMKFHHSGNPVTADDFIYWFDRGKGTESGGLFNIDIAKIASWEKTGDYQIKLTFSEKTPYFFFLFRDQSQAPLDTTVIQENVTGDDEWATQYVANHDVGSGEYYLQNWDPGVEMVLCANPDYWAGVPFFKKVVLKTIPAEADRVLLLQEGSVDIAETLSIDALNGLRGSEGVSIISQPTRNQIMLGMNNQMEPFDDKKVRQALSYAVPYDEIVEAVYEGQAGVSMGPIPVGGQYFNESLWPYSFDQAKARDLLAEAGLEDGFEFTVNFATGDASIEQLAVLLQTRFAEIGVTMQIQKDTPAVFAEGQDARSQQAWIRDLLWYVDDPGYTAQAFFKSGGCCGWANYDNPRINELADEMGTLANEGDERNQKQELADEYQQILIEDAPVLYLAQTNFQLATRADITGYEHGPDNILWYYPLKRE